jgi:hypothetical protein
MGRKDVIFVIVETDDNIKLTQIWLTNAEQDDPAIAKRIQMIYRANHARRYKTAVFYSGSGSLLESAKGLILGNMDK